MPPNAPVNDCRLLEVVLLAAEVGADSVEDWTTVSRLVWAAETTWEVLEVGVPDTVVETAVSFGAVSLGAVSLGAAVAAPKEVVPAAIELVLAVAEELVEIGSPFSSSASTSLKLVWMPKTALKASAATPCRGISAAAAV